jgi:hypothetical protein
LKRGGALGESAEDSGHYSVTVRLAAFRVRV